MESLVAIGGSVSHTDRPMSAPSPSVSLTGLRSRAGWLVGLRWGLVFSPAWVLAWLVATHAVNIPVWDGWERALLLEKWEAGTMTFADLYAPHIDHRIVFPRLLILLVAEVAQGDVRWEIGATWLFGLAAGIGVWRLARDTMGPGGWSDGVALLANLWIFSPLQYDNWLWPIQTAFVLPLPCLVWAIWVTLRPWHWATRLSVAGALAIVGTHSFSHGLFIWPAVGMLALLLPRSAPAAAGRWWYVMGWALLGAVVVGCYFGIDYRAATAYSYGQKAGELTPLAGTWRAALGDFGTAWTFFLTILGGPWVRQFAVDPLPGAPAMAWVAMAGYAAAGMWALWRRRRGDTEGWARALPWLALGGAVIAIALGASVGRSTILAPARAAVPRFLTVSLYLPVALLALARLVWLSRRPGSGERLIPWGLALLGGLVALQVQPWLYGARLMAVWQASRLQAQAHVQFIGHFNPEPIRILAYHVEDVQRFAPILDRLGLLEPPLVKDLRLEQFSISKTPISTSKAALERAAPGPEGKWLLEGHANLSGLPRPADAVLITVESPDEPDPMIVGLAERAGTQLPTRYRIDLQFSVLDELNMKNAGTWLRWQATLDPAALPKSRPLTVRAWVYDQTKRRAYPMAQRLVWEADGAAELRE